MLNFCFIRCPFCQKELTKWDGEPRCYGLSCFKAEESENHLFHQELGTNQFVSYLEFSYQGVDIKIGSDQSYFFLNSDEISILPFTLDDQIFNDHGISDWFKKKLSISISFA